MERKKHHKKHRKNHRDDPCAILSATILPMFVAKLDHLKREEEELEKKLQKEQKQTIPFVAKIDSPNAEYEDDQRSFLGLNQEPLPLHLSPTLTKKQLQQRLEDENVVWVIAPKENYSVKENLLMSVQSSMPSRLLERPFEYVQNELLK
ncbi:UNVERIFIED_CONTAM: hypothetical protein HDU68_012054 [Siphonaria sp. JEL0065]|nr:hypothetical protein HDU68_012054 [Siphonaria sp. JEL0065]